MNEQLREPINRVLVLLVTGKYAELTTLTHGNRLTAKEIATAITDYGRTLIIPPEDAYGLMNVVEVTNAQPKRWSIAMPLWTQEEGRSDLTLELTVIKHQNKFVIELDDIHVL